MSQFVSQCCMGEKCWCGAPAAHKVEEVLFPDDPFPARHPFTAYLCREHFRQIMGPVVTEATFDLRLALPLPEV